MINLFKQNPIKRLPKDIQNELNDRADLVYVQNKWRGERIALEEKDKFIDHSLTILTALGA